MDQPAGAVRKAFESHKKWAAFKNVPPGELAVSLRIITRTGDSKRICKAAFDTPIAKFGFKA